MVYLNVHIVESQTERNLLFSQFITAISLPSRDRVTHKQANLKKKEVELSSIVSVYVKQVRG